MIGTISPISPTLAAAGVASIVGWKSARSSGVLSHHMSVATGPGLTQFTVTSCLRPSSVAHTLHMPSRAAFVPA